MSYYVGVDGIKMDSLSLPFNNSCGGLFNLAIYRAFIDVTKILNSIQFDVVGSFIINLNLLGLGVQLNML